MGSYSTQFKTTSGDVRNLKTDVVIIPVYQKKKKDTSAVVWTDVLKTLDTAIGGHVKAVIEAEKFKGDCGKRKIIKTRPDDLVQARWIVVLGLGAPDKLDIRKATQAFLSAHKDTYGFENVNHTAVVLPDASEKFLPQAVVFGALQSTYKTQEADPDKIHTLKSVTLVSSKAIAPVVLKTAEIMGFAESFAKDLCNRPANLKTAEDLAQAALSYADLPNVTVDVLSDQKKIKKDMPAFWAVGQAASKISPLRFIKVHYKPAGKITRKIALVGKGVIFDTGGVQVKTGTYMNDMKFDMTGAATVLAVVKACAELKLKGVAVSAYVAATPNLIGEDAYLPDSIIDSASGKKIEIRHTDAEGRVTLADSVYKATLDKPDEIVTIATLTGSAVQAVGHCIALMGTNDKLVSRIEKSVKAIGEPVQALDLFEEDFENIKSDRDAADFANVSKGKTRGHMSAGAFVISFANDIPTAHLDIAGGDAKDGNATGISVKGLIEFVKNSAG